MYSFLPGFLGFILFLFLFLFQAIFKFVLLTYWYISKYCWTLIRFIVVSIYLTCLFLAFKYECHILVWIIELFFFTSCFSFSLHLAGLKLMMNHHRLRQNFIFIFSDIFMPQIFLKLFFAAFFVLKSVSFYQNKC